MGINILILFAVVVITGASSASVMLIMKKYDLFNQYDIYRKKWMPQSCQFCTGFWVSLLIMVLSKLFLNLDITWWFCIGAFPAASISLKLST